MPTSYEIKTLKELADDIEVRAGEKGLLDDCILAECAHELSYQLELEKAGGVTPARLAELLMTVEENMLTVLRESLHQNIINLRERLAYK